MMSILDMYTFTPIPIDVSGWYCCSRYRQFNAWLMVEILDVDRVKNLMEVYVQIGCPSYHYTRVVWPKSDVILMPADRDSLLVHCDDCGRPIYRVRGLVSRMWMMEIVQ